MKPSFTAKYGPWALITGASRGLGAEFARQCAERGLNVLLIATNEALLKENAESIKKNFGVRVITLALDLCREDVVKEITPVTDSLEIGLLINNAGISRVRPFLHQSPEDLVKQLRVNAQAGLILSHHFGKKMAERQRGGIVFLSSASALFGTAYTANYAATKAYNLIFAEALWYELGRHGVDVLGFMAGPTKTPGWDSNNPKPSRLIKPMGVKRTVAEALKALGNRPSVIAGRSNRLGYFLLGRMFSRKRAIKTIGKSMCNLFGEFEEQ